MLPLLTTLALLQAGPPVDPEEPAARPVAPAPRDGAASVKERYAFVSFGGDLLGESDVVAEVAVESVRRAGPGVEVVRMKVEAVHLRRGADPRVPPPREVVALAAPGDYRLEQRYVAFLSRLESSSRFESLKRIMVGERDFAAKRKVLARYATLEPVEDDAARAVKIRDALLEFVRDDELFVKWNALSELESFVKSHKLLFDAPHRATLVAAFRAEPSPSARRRMAAVLAELGIGLQEGRDG